MYLVGVELVRERMGQEVEQLTSVNHVTHLQVRHIHVLFININIYVLMIKQGLEVMHLIGVEIV